MRPPFLTKLTRGVLIDTIPGFVDTFNWLVDFCDNLRGEGQLDPSKTLTVDTTVDDHPVIRGGGGGGGMNLIPGDDTNIVFTPYEGGRTKVDVYYS